MPAIRILANPAAGGGSAARAIPRIRRLMDECALQGDLVLSKKPAQIIELARQAGEEGVDVVVAAGGDGTVNEAINGLIETHLQRGHAPALGVLCIGRGNDFAYSVGIPRGLRDGFATILQGVRRKVDVGRVRGGLFPQGRYFGNCVGVGFDAIGTIEAARLRRLGGFLSYMVAVLRTIFLYFEAPPSTVRYDEHQINQRSLLVSVMNGRRLGGGFYMAPQAEIDDGHFDLCIASQVSRGRIFQLIPYFMRGTHASQPEIQVAQARHITVEALEGSLPAQADGEILCVDDKRLEIEIFPQMLEVLVPGSQAT